MAGFISFIANGVDLVFMGLLGADGYLTGEDPEAPAAGASAGSGMLRVKNVSAADLTVPAPDVVPNPGDNGSAGSFILPSTNDPAFNMDVAVFSLSRDAKVQNTKVFADGDENMGVLKPNTFTLVDLCYILQRPSKKKDTGMVGRKAWSGYYVPIANAIPLGGTGLTTRGAAVDRLRVLTIPADMLFDGILIDTDQFGTDGTAVVPFSANHPRYAQRWVGDGTQDEYTLNVTPIPTAAECRIRVNGTLAVFGTDYILSERTITWQAGQIPALDDAIVFRGGFDPNG